MRKNLYLYLMSTDLRKGSHTLSHLTCRVVWVAKFYEEMFKSVAENF
jgi:hypothetical protein